MRPRAPSGFSNYKRIRKMLVGAVGIEPNASLVSTGGSGRIPMLRRHQPGRYFPKNAGTCNKRATSSPSESKYKVPSYANRKG